MEWSTACTDWERRIVARESMIPIAPLYPDEAEESLKIFRELHVVDVAGSPKMGAICRPWLIDFVGSVFGAYNAQVGRRLITEFFMLISKKNAKALDLSTPIPTPTGWKTMGELVIGDQVFDNRGEVCRITATSPVFTDHDCYRVTFSNGETVIADAGHLWWTYALQDAPGSGRGRKNHKARRARIRTTEEIAATLLRNDGARNHSVRMPDCLALEDVANLPIPPYTLGAWLGDGHSAQARITCADEQIMDEIKADGFVLGKRTHIRASKAWTQSIRTADRVSRFPGLLRSLDLVDNKHIPDVYLRAGTKQRLALLQGLMDTDGTISKSGRVLSFTNTNEWLVRNVAELLSTLGLKYSLIRRPMRCNGRPVSGWCWVLQFMASRDVPVFRLRRKFSRMHARNRLSRCRTVQIVHVERVPCVPVKCISVDSLSHQFLFGKTMLPTHNSTTAAGIMLTALIRNWRQSAEFLILAPTIEIANNSFYPARDMVRADDELSALLHVQDHLRTITHRNSGATLKVVAADNETVGGKKATGVLIDELWLFGKRANAENMLREATGGLASRPEGFTIFLSTQSDDPPAGVFRQKLQYARGVRDGRIVDPCFLPVIYEYPAALIESESHKDKAFFYVTNPNLGASVDEAFLEREFQKAENDGEESMRGFLAKHLNVEIGIALQSNRWAGADFWARCGSELSLEGILSRCEVVDIGIDGGGLDDMLAIVVLGRDAQSGAWLHWAHAWIHPIVLERRKVEAPRFRDFARDGDLTIVKTIGDDVDQVAEYVKRVNESGLLDKIGVDQAGIGAIVDGIVDAGIDQERIIGIPQGWRMVGAIKTTERRCAEGSLEHGGRPLMAWCVGNARVEPRGNAVIISKQAAGSAKIDPLMATFNAVALMSMNPQPAKSFWE